MDFWGLSMDGFSWFKSIILLIELIENFYLEQMHFHFTLLWSPLTLVLTGVILIKKAGDGDSKKIKGCWDSIHVVEVQEKSSGRSAHYKLTSTSMLWLQTNKPRSGTMNLGGSLTRQVEQDCSVSEASPHIANIGEEKWITGLLMSILSSFRSSSRGHGKQN